MARFTAFLDACVLVPIAPCDTLLRMADSGAFRPLWSQRVVDEAQRALERIHPAIDPSRFQSRFRSMGESFEDAVVEGWESLEAGMTLPDPDDCHVLAAALRGRADAIVTENIKYFPQHVLEPLGIEAITVDDFLLAQLDLGPDATVRIIEAQAAQMRQPPVTAAELLRRLAGSGAPRFADAVAQVIESSGRGSEEFDEDPR